jgi:hypothetical protein
MTLQTKEGETVTANSASNSAAFGVCAIRRALRHAVGEDDMAIGYGTALLSCVSLLALGFGPVTEPIGSDVHIVCPLPE